MSDNPIITFPTIDLIRDYFDEPNLGKDLEKELCNKEIGLHNAANGFYFDYPVKEAVFSDINNVLSVIKDFRKDYIGIDIPIFLKNKKTTKKTIMILGQDPLRSKDPVQKKPSKHNIFVGTPFALDVDMNTISNIPRASSYKRKWELYASIAKKLMIEHDYNVYFTDLFKFYTDETRTEVNKNGKEILKQNVDFLSEANFPSGKDPYTLLLKEIDRIEPERIIIFGNKSEKNIKANIKNVNVEIKKVIHPSAYNGITAEKIIDQIFNNDSISFNKGAKTSNTLKNTKTAAAKRSIVEQTRQKLIDEGLITNKRDESKYINSILDETNQNDSVIRYRFEKEGLYINVFWNRAETNKNTDIMQMILKLLNTTINPKTKKNTSSSATTQCFICSYAKTPDEIVHDVIDFESRLKLNL